MAVYLHKLTATGKYDARVLWDGVAAFPVPAGHTRELDTGANGIQAVADIAAAAAADLAASQATLRDIARNFLLNDPRPEMKALRAVVLVLVDELNLLRANVSNTPAGSPMPARTSAQALTAITNKLTAGSAD